jgi:putative membrane protein
MSGFMGSHGWSWGLFGVLHMLAFWGLVIGGIWLLVRLLGEGRASRERTPLEILQVRYARGEIDKAEYEARKADLER